MKKIIEIALSDDKELARLRSKNLQRATLPILSARQKVTSAYILGAIDMFLALQSEGSLNKK